MKTETNINNNRVKFLIQKNWFQNTMLFLMKSWNITKLNKKWTWLPWWYTQSLKISELLLILHRQNLEILIFCHLASRCPWSVHPCGIQFISNLSESIRSGFESLCPEPVNKMCEYTEIMRSILLLSRVF